MSFTLRFYKVQSDVGNCVHSGPDVGLTRLQAGQCSVDRTQRHLDGSTTNYQANTHTRRLGEHLANTTLAQVLKLGAFLMVCPVTVRIPRYCCCYYYVIAVF